jgi:hypothetical protein
MPSELRLSDHMVRPGQKVIEIWFDGKFIGQVTAADGPGVRIISKHAMATYPISRPQSQVPGIVDVVIYP